MPPTSKPRTTRLAEHHEPDSTWEEIGFAEFPLVTTALKRPPFDTLEFLQDLGRDEAGATIHRTWKLVGSREYGLPRLPDLDVFVALLRLLEQHNYEKRVVACTIKDICDIAGLRPGGATYQRVKDALVRFATTTYVSDRVFTDKATKQKIGLETWEIIVESRFTYDGRIEVLPSYFEVSKRFLEKLRNGQLKTVDLKLWRELPLGLEKPLYHFIDKNLYRKDRYEIGLCKLSKRIALTGKYGPGHLQRLYRKPLTNLVNIDFLSDFRFDRTKTKDDPVKVILFPGPRARRKRRTSQQAPARPTGPKRAAQGNSEPSEKRQAVELVRHFHRLISGIESKHPDPSELAKARNLIQLQGGYELARYTVDFAVRAGKKTNYPMQNFGSVIRGNNYLERARLEKAREKPRLRMAANIRDANKSKDNAQDESWRALPEKERESRIQAQLARVNADRERRYGRDYWSKRMAQERARPEAEARARRAYAEELRRERPRPPQAA